MLYYLDSSCQLDGNLTWYFPVDGKVFWRIFAWAAQQLSLSLPRNETQKLLLPLNALTLFRQCEVHANTLLNPHKLCIRAVSDTLLKVAYFLGMAKQRCYSLALSLLLASSTCTSPHIHHTPSWRWRQSLCGVGGLLALWNMTCANKSCNTVLFTAQSWCGKTVLSASLSSFELAQSLALFCGVPLAQVIAQADSPEVELVYNKTPNYFNLNLKRR